MTCPLLDLETETECAASVYLSYVLVFLQGALVACLIAGHGFAVGMLGLAILICAAASMICSELASPKEEQPE